MMWLINNWRYVALFLIAVAISFFSYHAGEDKVQGLWDADKLKQTQIIAEANKRALEIERKSQEALAQKQKELENEKRNTEMAITSADHELGRLHNTLANLKHKLSTTTQTPSPSDAALTQSWTLLGDCAKEYQQMGQVADQQRDKLAEWQGYGETIEQFREDVKKLENVKDNLM